VTVAVIGAGPAGLMAALRVARTGRPVTVYEREERVGGMAASVDVAGIRADLGSHRLHPSIEPELRAELEALLGDDLQVRPRNGRIRLAGRWLAFPLRTGDLLGNLPRGMALRAARDSLTAPFRRSKADTFAAVLRAGLGPTITEAFYVPYARKLWGVEADELSGELARRRVSAGGPAAIARRLLSGASTFLYPARGFGQISERLAEAVVDAGGELRLGAEVRDLDGLDADLVFSTLPITVLAALAGGPTTDLEHRAMVLVHLALDQRPYTEFDAHYFPEAGLSLSRLSEPTNYRDGPDDPPDRTVLCAEVPCSVGDETWRARDADLGQRVVDDLARAGLPAPAVAHVQTVRLPRVYPVYRVGFEQQLAPLLEWARGLDRVMVFGRQGLFVPDNTHHALAMGAAAADALRPDDTFDRARWDRALEGFRSNVVED
jgi:protoporphyrinogen oxidase